MHMEWCSHWILKSRTIAIFLIVFTLVCGRSQAETWAETVKALHQPNAVIPQASSWFVFTIHDPFKKAFSNYIPTIFYYRPSISFSSNEMVFYLEPAERGTLLDDVCRRELHEMPFSCPHELWVLLDLDQPEWSMHSQFTLRISHPSGVRLPLCF